MVFARGTEGNAGNDGNVLFFEKPVSERFAVHTESSDAREDVKSPERSENVEPEIGEGIKDETSSDIVFVAHIPDGGKPVFEFFFENGDSGVLSAGRRAHNCVLMNFIHGESKRRRSENVTEPPTRHGIDFGKAADHHGIVGELK